jgi:hypothetical protein
MSIKNMMRSFVMILVLLNASTAPGGGGGNERHVAERAGGSQPESDEAAHRFYEKNGK